MATWIHVVCRSAEPVTYSQLEDVMGHMGWLDRPATFDPPLDNKNAADPHWGSFRVVYDPNKRPITVRHQTTAQEAAPILSDIREKLDEVENTAVTRQVLAWLEAARQLFIFEIPGDPPTDVWEMLDAAEGFLARERDGIIVADEGIFDGDMNRILEFREEP